MPPRQLRFEQLFAMPQSVDPLALAAAHGSLVVRSAALKICPRPWSGAGATVPVLLHCLHRPVDDAEPAPLSDALIAPLPTDGCSTF